MSDPYQLSLIESSAAAELGMERVERGADSEWMKVAWATLIRYLQTHDTFFVDDFWRETGLERPRESRALGPLVKRAAQRKLMVKTSEFRKSTASNMTEKPVWRSLICP